MQWKPIPGYEELYEISDSGNVRNAKTGKILILEKDKKSYLRIGLYKNGKRKGFLVHRLVYSAFNGEIPPGLEVNHINEEKTDNRLENLNLMTSKENSNWGTRNERISKPVIAYDKQGNFVQEFGSITEAEKWLGIDGAHRNICHCLSKRYNFAYGYIWKYA